MKTESSFSKTTIILHWIVGLTIIVLIAVGLYMSEYDVDALYPIHKSIGVILFVFILVRVYNRAKKGWPSQLGEVKPWEHTLSKIVLWVLIIGTLLFPISGMMMSGAGGYGISVFGLDLLSANIGADGKAIALNKTLAGLGHETHEILGTVMMIAISLHILASLKHHYVLKDNTLKRMLGRQ
jgi:cytochrome b561